MKKTTRLTALLLALVLLLANLSASATETTEGVPLEDLDMATYSTMLMTASEEGVTAGYSGVCTDENCLYPVYDAIEATKIGDIVVSKEVMQYKYLMGELYDLGNSLEAFMLHAFDYHNMMLDNMCNCGVEVLIHAPGAMDHEDESCPWYNLTATVEEHYAAYNTLTSMANRAYYLMGLDQKQLDGINALMSETQKAEMTYLVQEGIPDYLRTEAVQNWIASNADVSAEMVNRAYEVKAQLTESGAEYTELDALRLEGTKLISVETGAVIATYDETTGALTDCAMGLIVGYVDVAKGTIVASLSGDETTTE